MQYSLVILLIIVSFQAVRAFKEKAFYIIAAGWFANLLYLITTEHTPQFGSANPFVHKYVGTFPGTLDFIASSLFWYAARKYGHWKRILYLPRFNALYFFVLLLGGHFLAVSLEQILPQQNYFNFVVASLPVILIDMLSLVVLAYYFRELVARVKGPESRVHLLHFGTFFYALIQLFQLFLHPWVRNHIHLETSAFILGFAAKSAIFFGIIDLFVASAATLTNSIAERRKAHEFSIAIDRLAHELGTPLSEIQNGVLALKIMRTSEIPQMLDQIENAASRALAIVGASSFAGVPATMFHSSMPNSAARKEVFDKTQIVNLNTIVEIAQNAVKTTRTEKVTYRHRYSSRCCLECKPAELVQILINVFRNAHDSFGDKRGTIDIQTINEKSDDAGETGYSYGKIKLTVRDNGEGIKPENMDKIFKEGYSTRPGTGRGHGLAITKRLVQEHRGTIEIHSPPTHGSAQARQGTEIVLTFPRMPCLPS
jgi:signal transduction histidine kinase